MPVSICDTPHTCVECKRAFLPKRTDRVTFCSKACAYAKQKADALARAKARAEDRAMWASFSIPKTKPKPTPKHVSCAICTSVFVVHGLSKAAKLCSEACKREAKRRSARRVRIKSGTSQTHRARARRAGVEYVPVSALSILDRDGWRCQICGIATPRRLRGTYAPNAPELDHVVPLAQKGPHTPSNLQCACRACNNAKGGG